MDMIETVARALYANHLTEFSGPVTPTNYDDLPDFSKAYSLGQARAAIEAMREATEKMTEAAGRCEALMWSPEEGEGLDGVSWSTAWTAMIDAALGK